MVLDPQGGSMSTSLPNPETEKRFEEYRQYLVSEAIQAASYVALFRKLYERRRDRLEVMNIAPAFFETVTNALRSAIILWVDKLFDERGERGIFNFLAFIEQNRNIFAIEQLKRRKNYPNDHWMLNRVPPITLETITEDRERIKSIDCLKSFKTRRDKAIAHFDKKYFDDPERLSEEAPLTWGDLNKVIEALGEIINRYSAAYDAQSFSLRLSNINDLDYLLDRLHRSTG
jgi:AbiU2